MTRARGVTPSTAQQLLEHDDVAGRSKPRASTTFIASLSMTSWPSRSVSTSTFGRPTPAACGRW
jgi:hypothetical protein